MSRAEREKETPLKDLLPIVWLTHPSFLLPCRDAQFFLSFFYYIKHKKDCPFFCFFLAFRCCYCFRSSEIDILFYTTHIYERRVYITIDSVADSIPITLIMMLIISCCRHRRRCCWCYRIQLRASISVYFLRSIFIKLNYSLKITYNDSLRV